MWGAIPGALKAYLGVNEILSTIMLNIVAVQVVTYLLRGPLIDPRRPPAGAGSRRPSGCRRTPTYRFSSAAPGCTSACVVAVAVAVLAWVFLWQSSLGYRVRAVGAGPDAARYAGIPVRSMTCWP